MLKVIVFTCVSIALVGCGSGPEVSEEPVTNTKEQSKRVAKTVASHTIKRTPEQKSANTADPFASGTKAKRKWSRGGDPIDTTELDRAVSKADAALKKQSGNEAAKKSLANAYFERGVELTSARQYAAAMGDFRKALKLDPSNEGAKKQLAMISSIYRTMNIEAPAEGEEPAPLEFKAQKN